MHKHTLVISTVLFAFDANAGCMIDAPEIGDIGPSSELVCRDLEARFPNSILAVRDRHILTPEEVGVQASVDGQVVTLRYELSGFAWRTAEDDAGHAHKDLAAEGLSMR